MPVQEQDYALVIGFNHYPRYGKNGRSLRGAIQDAKEFSKWLTDKNIGGGLPDENCKLIVSSVSTVNPPQPRKDRIDDCLEEIWTQAQKTGARRFYFYFSGHGQTQVDQDVFLCLPTWARNREAAALSIRKYQQVISQCIPFQEIVIFMDCCRSLKVGARGQESELSCPLPHAAAGLTAVFVGHATEFQAQSFESAIAGEGDDEDNEPIVRGHFSEALMAALRGAAARETGGVPASSLVKYLRKVVPRIARRHRHEQRPRFEPFDIPEGDPAEPIFGAALPIKTVDVKFSFKASRSGEILLEGPELQQIRVSDAATGPWEETLEPGTYMLTEKSTGEFMSVHLNPTEGEFNVEF